MAMLKNLTRGTQVTDLVSLIETATPRQVVATAMDGTTYIQSVGRAQTTYQLTVYLQPRERNEMDRAWWAADLMEVSVKQGVFQGRITAVTYGSRMAMDWYEARVTLRKEEE